MSEAFKGHKCLIGDKRRKVILNGCPIYIEGRMVIEVAEEATPSQEAHMLTEEPEAIWIYPSTGKSE